MVSVPTYDPGALNQNGEKLLTDPDSPLLNRATQGKYPPGSTFKTVTAASALENNVITPETTVTCPGEIVIDGFPISCNNVPQGTGTYPFRDAFAYSVNAIFAQVGVEPGLGSPDDDGGEVRIRLGPAVHAGHGVHAASRPRFEADEAVARQHRVRPGRTAGDTAPDGGCRRRPLPMKVC